MYAWVDGEKIEFFFAQRQRALKYKRSYYPYYYVRVYYVCIVSYRRGVICD